MTESNTAAEGKPFDATFKMYMRRFNDVPQNRKLSTPAPKAVRATKPEARPKRRATAAAFSDCLVLDVSF